MTILRSKYLIPAGFALIFLLLPTHNSGIDAYAYASAVKWGTELVWPHHLLVCFLGRAIFNLTRFFLAAPDALVLMKGVNALAAGFSLYFFYRILESLKIYKAGYFVIFCGACFGFMRFATESETYVLPILCSLAATYCFVVYFEMKSGLWLCLSGLLFGLGALFHQIHIFWFGGFALALYFSKPKTRVGHRLLFLFSGGFILFVTYFIVYHWGDSGQPEGWGRFLFRDVYAGRVETRLSWRNLLMTPVSLVRTFIQVHGYMADLLKAFPVLYLVLASFILVVGMSIKKLVTHTRRVTTELKPVSKAVLYALLLQFAFAFYSVGNAEFMVMLPFLAILWLVMNFAIPVRPVLHIALALLFYNGVFGLLPLHFLDMDGSSALIEKMKKEPNAVWVLDEPQKMENRFRYESGNSPLILKTTDNFSKYLKDGRVLTDVPFSPKGLNRQRLLSEANTEEVWKNYELSLLDSIAFFGGIKKIHRVDERQGKGLR